MLFTIHGVHDSRCSRKSIFTDKSIFTVVHENCFFVKLKNDVHDSRCSRFTMFTKADIHGQVDIHGCSRKVFFVKLKNVVHDSRCSRITIFTKADIHGKVDIHGCSRQLFFSETEKCCSRFTMLTVHDLHESRYSGNCFLDKRKSRYLCVSHKL